jgi:hypothetical protein
MSILLNNSKIISKTRVRTRFPLLSPQLVQFAGYHLVTQFMLPLAEFMNQLYKRIDGRMSGFNKVYVHNLQDAVKIKRRTVVIDYPRVKLSKGRLPNPEDLFVVSAEEGKILFNWWDNSGVGKALPSDEVFIAVYCEALNSWRFKPVCATRKTGCCKFYVPAFRDQEVQCYIGFRSADRVRTSNSLYAGMVKVL